MGKILSNFMMLATFAVLVHALPNAASAAETMRYTYDALGRLTSVTHVGGDNDGMVINFSYDAAGNRTQYQVTGSRNSITPPPSPTTTFIIVPLNGFTLIPIAQ
jgi:hypothetical protein